MALFARPASMPGRTGAALFKPASCRRIDYSAKRLSERTLLFDKNDVAAGINRASGPAAMSDDFYDLSGMDARQAYPAMDGRYTRGQ